MSVEVERKFFFNADTLKAVEDIGVCVDQRQFHDEYYDTPHFDLTLRDTWLRNRKGCWELKCPIVRVNGTEDTNEECEAAALCTRYKEITNLPDIQLKLEEMIKDICEDMTSTAQEAMSSVSGSYENQSHLVPAQHGLEMTVKNSLQSDKSWLRKMNLVCFAAFTTIRRSFTLEEEGVRIDLDQADFGYRVGEIEVLVPEGGDIQSALGKIERTAQKLGLSGGQQVEGKMNVYLKKNYPEHYTKLLSERIL